LHHQEKLEEIKQASRNKQLLRGLKISAGQSATTSVHLLTVFAGRKGRGGSGTVL
jgi:hypothetical protein